MKQERRTMLQQWTFSRRINISLAVAAAFTIIVGLVAISTLRDLVASNERVVAVNIDGLLRAKQLELLIERKSAAARGFLFNGDERFARQVHAARDELIADLDEMERNPSIAGSAQAIADIRKAADIHQQASDRVAEMRRGGASAAAIVKAFDDDVLPKRERITSAIRGYVALQERRVADARREESEGARIAISLMSGAVAVGGLFAVLVALFLSRALNRQIGTAVAHVQSSSAELQTAANQQATGAKEQTTAMSEITTTISELLATSRQIAESAQRVAEIAERTTAAAQSGDSTVDQAHDSIAGIRQQMDMVVAHMLELGRKSQQVGTVVDIVSELAEQTNILAINATIEAAGAGDSGRRFAVVADEIRQLADRVTGSTKEIRPLIDDMRGAVNTTIMATETGSKAVDGGSRQFGDVASSFKQIAALLITTTEAAREIELSTKQQSSAVEQVNAAIANVAQTTRESEVSARQTLDTVSQLAGLSRDLLRLVQPQAAAA
jgi:methyl-accepting chemotaxis protein